MSIHLMSKAFKCQQVKGNEKFLLLALADNASDNEGEYGTCFPSIRTLTEKTGLSNRAVINNLEKLIEKGLLLRQYRSRKSGGRTSNKYLIFPSETYDLLSDKNKAGFTQSEESSPLKTETQSEESSHQELTQSEESSHQNKTQSEESSHLINHHSKSIKPSPIDINRELTLDDKPESVDVNVWFSFLKHRKSKKSKLTELAMKGIMRESANAGMDLEEALLMIMERSWTGFKAEWVNKQSNHSQASRHTGFDKRDYTRGLIEQEDGTYAF